jgi:lipopolysaccharide transport system ATP-binding protein
MSSESLLKECALSSMGNIQSDGAQNPLRNPIENDIAIRVRNLSKCYQLYDRPEDRLKQILLPRLRRLVSMEPRSYGREFWALHDVSFEVSKGEAVGIIGRNGAGKSTLLQLICGTLSPTSGSVDVAGTVAALLELGSGFNPEFTGRENVYLNASVLGLTHEETNRKFDEIAAFADIGDFLEQPTKTYSSGMLMRLAFAVNTCIDPDILIVDEALGVGDAPFQSKCYKRLRRLIDNGKSVLFVSHDISTVRAICHRALWLKSGRTEMCGEAKEVAKEYEKFCWLEQGVALMPFEDEFTKTASPESTLNNGILSCSAPPILFQTNPTFEASRQNSRMGTGDVIIKNFLMVNESGHPVTSCDYNEELRLYYLLEVSKPVNSDFVIGVWFRDLKGNSIYSANDLNRIHTLCAEPGERFVVSAKLRIPLTHQNYEVHTSIFGFKNGKAHRCESYDFAQAVIWDMTDNAAYLRVHLNKLMPVAGPVGASFDLRIEKL